MTQTLEDAARARLHRESTLLMIVDVQTRLMPVIHEAERVEQNAVLLAQAANELKIPVLITEQNPRHLGQTIEPLRPFAPETPMEKMRFSACTDSVNAAIAASERKTILLCGVEAHVCVLQTALDLLRQEYSVFVARDAISSRTPQNAEIGWQRMLRAGAVPTSAESAVFELLEEAGTAEFRTMLRLVK